MVTSVLPVETLTKGIKIQSCNPRHFFTLNQVIKTSMSLAIKHSFKLTFSNTRIYWAFTADDQESRLSKRWNQAIKTLFSRSSVLIPVASLSTSLSTERLRWLPLFWLARLLLTLDLQLYKRTSMDCNSTTPCLHHQLTNRVKLFLPWFSLYVAGDPVA